MRLAGIAIEECAQLDDPRLLIRAGLLEIGADTPDSAEALADCGEPFEWLEPAEATGRFPEARFREPALFTADAGSGARRPRACIGCAAISTSARAIAWPTRTLLEADVVCVSAGGWLGQLFELPLRVQLEQVAYVARPSRGRR